jgi:hypothetical protein
MIGDRRTIAAHASFALHRLVRSIAAILCASTLSLAAFTSFAEEKRNPALGEELFERGKKAMANNRLVEACELFAASFAADPSVGAKLNLARCHEQQGKTATAWAEYKQAATLARAANQPDREAGAKELANKLEKQLSKIAVRVAASPPGLVVKVDDQELPAISFGAMLPVDPGEHTVEANATGMETFSTVVTVAPIGDRKTVLVPALQKVSGNRRAHIIAGSVLTGIGGGLLVGGTIEGIRAIGLRKDIASNCDPDLRCSADTLARVDKELKPMTTRSTVFLIAGGVVAATGVVVLVTAPRRTASPAKGAVTVAPMLGETTGLVLFGSF